MDVLGGLGSQGMLPGGGGLKLGLGRREVCGKHNQRCGFSSPLCAEHPARGSLSHYCECIPWPCEVGIMTPAHR